MFARMWRERDTYLLLVGVGRALREMSLEISQRTKTMTIIRPCYFFPMGVYAKILSDYRDAFMAMFTSALFIRRGRWKEPRCTSTGE